MYNLHVHGGKVGTVKQAACKHIFVLCRPNLGGR